MVHSYSSQLVLANSSNLNTATLEARPFVTAHKRSLEVEHGDGEEDVVLRGDGQDEEDVA